MDGKKKRSRRKKRAKDKVRNIAHPRLSERDTDERDGIIQKTACDPRQSKDKKAKDLLLHMAY